MGKRQREWASRKRLDLIEQLGGRCVVCGETDTSQLAFDHLEGRTWTAHKIDSSWRMTIYVKEAAAGLLQLLCRVCNSKKGKPVSGSNWPRKRA